MNEYHRKYVRLSDSQLDKLKSATRNATGVTLRLSSDMIGTKFNIFPHSLSLINRNVAGLARIL